MVMYHQATRELQDAFGSRELADRLDKRLRHSAFTDEDADFIASLRFFFLATANAEGQPDCSFKGGDPGFVRVHSPGPARLPRLRRERNVQEPRQHPRQPRSRAALHRHGGQAQASARKRHGGGRPR